MERTVSLTVTGLSLPVPKVQSEMHYAYMTRKAVHFFSDGILKSLGKAMVSIMAMTLMAVAAIASRMINREKNADC
jgi:hypothetical protein